MFILEVAYGGTGNEDKRTDSRVVGERTVCNRQLTVTYFL